MLKDGGGGGGLTHLFYLLLRREHLGEELQVDLAVLERDAASVSEGDGAKDSIWTHQGLERRVVLQVVVQISVGHHPVHLDADKETIKISNNRRDFSPGLHDRLVKS